MAITLAPATDLGSPLGGVDRRFPRVHEKAHPGQYVRNGRWSSSQNTLIPPSYMKIDVGGFTLWLDGANTIDINAPASWDSASMAAPANRAGKDMYVYAWARGQKSFGLILSNNSTFPAGEGFTADNTRKLGGFHCLCLNVGNIPGHALSGYQTGDILPASVWDLRHRPRANPEGMVYAEQTGKWYQIYFTNVDGGSAFQRQALVHANGPDVHGLTKGSQLWYAVILAQYSLSLPTDREFTIVSLGSNAGTNSASGTPSLVAGGHVDTAGRRMISNIGLEDCCGFLWQPLDGSHSISASAVAGSTEYHQIPGGNGAHLGSGQIMMAGGHWASAENAGPVSRHMANTAWRVIGDGAARGCSEPLFE